MGNAGVDDHLLLHGGRAAALEGLPEVDPLKMPPINAGLLDLAAVAAEAWSAIHAANQPPTLFRMGGVIVRIERDEAGAPLLRPVTADRLRHALARSAAWYTKRRKARQSALPPMHVVRDMLARSDPPLPPLLRIVEAPIFGPAGSLVLEPGYHPTAHTYYAPAERLRIPPISAQPSPGEVGRAGHILAEELLGDFPFVSLAERTHAMALLLLPFLRELIDGPTPLHMIEKPSPGTGASLLAEAVTFPALGRPPGAFAAGRDDDEWRKRITAKLLGGASVLLIDNVQARLAASSLSAAITAPVWEDRLLGQSELARLPVRTVWIATGNNPTFSAEMARRIVRIRLDAKVDRPWLRDGFRHPDLRAWMTAHRGDLIWAALTLGQAWLAAGRPPGPQRLGSFEHWARVMGGLFEVAGLDGFLDNVMDFYDEADAEGVAWRALLTAWWEAHGEQPVGVSDLWTLVNPGQGDPIDLGLRDGTERSQKTQLGKLLSSVRDRQYEGLRILSVGTRQRAQVFRLHRIDQGTSQ